MLGVGATVEVKDDAIALDVESRDDDTIAWRRSLPLLDRSSRDTFRRPAIARHLPPG